jgi:hypothetical protein
VDEGLAFHIAMFIFLFSTTILMLNVLIGKPFICSRDFTFLRTETFTFFLFYSLSLFSCIFTPTALINVAFGKGDDGWRKAWIEARLRYIELAENLSYHLPGFRQTYDCFPKEIYFTASAKEVDRYNEKYDINNRFKFDGDHEGKGKKKNKNKNKNKSKGKKDADDEGPLECKPSSPRHDSLPSNCQDFGDPANHGLSTPSGTTFPMINSQRSRHNRTCSIPFGASSRGREDNITENRADELGGGNTQYFGSSTRGSDAGNSAVQQGAVSSGSRINRPGKPVGRTIEEGEASSGAVGVEVKMEEAKAPSEALDMDLILGYLRKLDAQMSKMDSVVQRVNEIEDQMKASRSQQQPSPHISLPDNLELLDSSLLFQ